MQAAAEQGPPQMLGAAGIFELPGRTSLEKTLPKKNFSQSMDRYHVVSACGLVGEECRETCSRRAYHRSELHK